MNRKRNSRLIGKNGLIRGAALGVILFWTLGLPLPVEALPALMVGSGQASCGQTITIPVTITGAENVDTFGMKFTYDPACLTYEGTVPGTSTANWASVNGNESTPGQVTLGGFKGAGTAVNGTGEVLRVSLRFRTENCSCQSQLGLTNLVDDVAGAAVTPGTASSTATGAVVGCAWIIRGEVQGAPTPTTIASPTPTVTATPNPTGTASPTPSPTPSPTGTQAGLALAVGSGQASCGGTAEISIVVSDATNVDAFGMTLTYDAGCAEFVSVSAGAATGDWNAVSGNETSPGQVALGGFKGSGTAVNGTGELVRVTLRCKVSACGCQSALNLVSLVDDVQGATVGAGSISSVGSSTPTQTATPSPTGTVSPTPSPTPSPSATQGGLTLTVGTGQASCGETTEISIAVSNATNIDAFGMTLTFDAGCAEFVSVSAGAATGDWAAVSGNETSPGQVALGGFKGLGMAVNGTGELVRITLRCKASACGCQSMLNLVSLVDDVQGATVVSGSISSVEGSTPTPRATPTATPSPTPSSSATPSPSPSATPSPTPTAQGEDVLVRQLFASACEFTQTATDLVSIAAEGVWLASEQNGWELTLTGTITQTAWLSDEWTYSPLPADKLIVVYWGELPCEFTFGTFDGYLDGTWVDFVDSHSLDFTAVIAGKLSNHIISQSEWVDYDVQWSRTITGTELFDSEMMTLNLTHRGTRSGYSFYPETVYDYNETCLGTTSSPEGTVTISEEYYHAFNNDDEKQEKWIGWRITNNSSAVANGLSYRYVDAFVQWDMISITGSPYGVSDPLYWFCSGTLEKDGQPLGSVKFTYEPPVMYSKGPDLVLHTVDGSDLFLHTLIE